MVYNTTMQIYKNILLYHLIYTPLRCRLPLRSQFEAFHHRQHPTHQPHPALFPQRAHRTSRSHSPKARLPIRTRLTPRLHPKCRLPTQQNGSRTDRCRCPLPIPPRRSHRGSPPRQLVLPKRTLRARQMAQHHAQLRNPTERPHKGEKRAKTKGKEVRLARASAPIHR